MLIFRNAANAYPSVSSLQRKMYLLHAHIDASIDLSPLSVEKAAANVIVAANQQLQYWK